MSRFFVVLVTAVCFGVIPSVLSVKNVLIIATAEGQSHIMALMPIVKK